MLNSHCESRVVDCDFESEYVYNSITLWSLTATHNTLLYTILTQTLRVAVDGHVPLSGGRARASLVPDQHKALVALKHHFSSGHEEEVTLPSVPGSLQDSARYH